MKTPKPSPKRIGRPPNGNKRFGFWCPPDAWQSFVLATRKAGFRLPGDGLARMMKKPRVVASLLKATVRGAKPRHVDPRKKLYA